MCSLHVNMQELITNFMLVNIIQACNVSAYRCSEVNMAEKCICSKSFKYAMVFKGGYGRQMEQWLFGATHPSVITRVHHLHTISPDIVLSKANRESCMTRLKNMRPVRVDGKIPMKKAAVLVPLCMVHQELSLLYTLRSSDLKNYRGQVSFPGGVQDATDKSLEETALRETHEELGIERSGIELWGHGNFVGTVRNDMVVLPCIGYIGEVNLKELILSPDEVESVFTASLKDLCDPSNNKYTTFRGRYSLPVFVGAEYRIWGMTAIITHMVLSALLPGIYKSKLNFFKLDESVQKK